MSTAQGTVLSATVDEAIDWYLKNRSQELSASARQEFAAWLRASPLNVREYLAIAALSNDLPTAADLPAAQLQTLIACSREAVAPVIALHSVPVVTHRAPRRRIAAIAASLAVLGLSALLYWAVEQMGTLRFLSATTYQTAHGEQRTIRLTDGSLMNLNSGSKVSVQFSGDQRRIELEKGQLMLNVFRDPKRPLSVRAGTTEVLAVGTKFDVYRKPDEVTVTVVEGRVLVQSEDEAVGASVPAIPLTVGQQVSVKRTALAPKAITVDLPTATAWLQGNIKFFRKPLAEVAAEFNRYSSTPVEIDGAALRELRVSGVFNAYDIDSFLEFVRRLDGVEVRRSAEHIRVVSRPNPLT